MKRFLLVAACAVAGFLMLPTSPAAAHPLGNFSVNRYAGLTLHPDHIEAVVVADVAELPTLQDPPATCNEAVSGLAVTVNGDRLTWTVKNSTFAYAEGAGGLRTSRLDCRLSAPAQLGRRAEVSVTNTFRDDRIGWRELAAAGAGIRLAGSPLPAASVSDELRRYPDDLLTSPDARSATFTAVPDASAGASPTAGSAPATDSPKGTLGLSGPLAGAERHLGNLIGGQRLTPLVGLLAVLLALVLGIAHAALPGHGKTVMAAYLAGRQGRARDAVAVGATVTLTHTGGVLLVGLLLTTVAGIAGEAVLGWLGVASGTLVATIGIGSLLSTIHRRRSPATPHTGHSHGLLHSHSHSLAHSHGLVHSHSHAPSHGLAQSHGLVPNRGSAHSDSLVPSHDPAQSHGHDLETNLSHYQAVDVNHSHDHNRDHSASHDPGHDHSAGPTPDHDHSAGHRPDQDARPSSDHADHTPDHTHGPHDHAAGHGHSHDHRPGKWSIAGLGIAGGLVPSPSALIVLLGAAALGRTVFGILLVIAYGVGMAATLTAAGLLLIRLRDRLEGRLHFLTRWQTVAPPATAALIIVVGLGLAGRALSTVA